MKETELICSYCGKKFNKDIKEYNRQVKKGRKEFFCSLSCGAKWHNKNKIKPSVEKICPVCGAHFITSTKERYNNTFCSRSCASKGSVTEYRRAKAKESGKMLALNYRGDINSIRALMLKREYFKYKNIDEYLTTNNISHEFEYIIENKLYDLAFLDKRLIIEFDGDDHKYTESATNDEIKESIAKKNGWTLVRINVKNNTVIPIDTILEFIL